jgi:ABC-type multidrug transport system ATPase subunit
MENYGLNDFKNTSCLNLSGGNKRKLITARAMIGEP